MTTHTSVTARRIRNTLGFFGLACCVEATTNLPPSAEWPAARLAHSMAYDSDAEAVLMFGGSVLSNQFFSDLWSWDGTGWTRLAQSGPPARENAVMAYDSHRRRIVLFGGAGRGTGGPQMYSDTWEWNGHAWTERPGTSPGARHHAAGAFDRNRGKLVVFGGFDVAAATPAPLFDTWEWDGAAWTLRDAAGPTGKEPVAMAYSEHLSSVVALFADFASVDSRGFEQGALWRWNGTQWTQLPGSAITVPAPLSMVSVTGGDLLLYVGGGSGGPVNTHRWNWSAWSTTGTTNPSRRVGAGVAFDVARGRAVLFGGATLTPEAALADLWEWSTTPGWTRSTASPPGN